MYTLLINDIAVDTQHTTLGDAQADAGMRALELRNAGKVIAIDTRRGAYPFYVYSRCHMLNADIWTPTTEAEYRVKLTGPKPALKYSDAVGDASRRGMPVFVVRFDHMPMSGDSASVLFLDGVSAADVVKQWNATVAVARATLYEYTVAEVKACKPS